MITLKSVKYEEEPLYQAVRPLSDDELLNLIRIVFETAERLLAEAVLFSIHGFHQAANAGFQHE